MAQVCNAVTRHPIKLESYPNDPRIQQVFCLKSKKNIFVFGVGFDGGTAASGGIFAFLWPPLPRPGPQPIGPLFWLKIFLETRAKSASLAVVCLRGGERGTCLGPPLFGGHPLRYHAHKFSLFLVKDVLFTHVMCYKANHKQVFCFQRAPYRKCNVQVLYFQRGSNSN